MRKHEVSEATLYDLKAKFGGMDVSYAKRLKDLEDENSKPKRPFCRRNNSTALKDFLSKEVMGQRLRVKRMFRPATNSRV